MHVERPKYFLKCHAMSRHIVGLTYLFSLIEDYGLRSSSGDPIAPLVTNEPIGSREGSDF